MSGIDEERDALLRDPASLAAADAVRRAARDRGELRAGADAFYERGRLLAERDEEELRSLAVEAFLEAGGLYEGELLDVESATAAYRAVLELQPGHRRAMFSLGLLLHDLDRFEELIELYRSRLERASDEGEQTTLHLYVSELLDDKLGDQDAAFEEIMAAARLAPRNLRIISRLERLGQATGRLDEVAVVLGDLLMNQDDPRVRAALALRLAELYLGPLDDAKRALAHFRSALADDGGNPELFQEVQDVFREQQRFDGLAELLEGLSEDRRTGPHRVRIERELARIYECELDDAPRALQILAHLAKEYPEERDLIDEVMRLGMVADDLETVADTYETVCTTTQNALLRTYLRLKLGHIYGQALRRSESAIRVYREIIEDEPDHREAQRRLAQLESSTEEVTQSGLDLERVGRSRVATDVSEEPTDFDGHAYGPESETAFSAENDAARGIVHLSTPDPDPTEAQVDWGRGVEPEEATVAELRAADDPELEPDPESDVVPSSPFESEDSEVEVDDRDVVAERRWTSSVHAPLEPHPLAAGSQLFEPDEARIAAPLHSPAPEEPPPLVLSPPETGLSGRASASARLETEERIVTLQQRLQDARRTDDQDAQRAALAGLSREYEAAGALDRAFDAEARLLRLEISRDGFERSFRLAREARALPEMVALYGELAGRLPTADQTRLGLEVANTEAEELGEVVSATSRLEQLHALAPDDERVFERWIELLEFSEQFPRLAEAWLEEGRRTRDVGRAKLSYQRAAEVLELRLQDASGAADVLLAYLDRDPADEFTQLEATRLLEGADRYDDLVVLLEKRIYQLAGPERAMLRRRVAAIYDERLRDPINAERMLRLARSEDERDAESLEQLVRILERAARWPDLLMALREQLPLAKGNRARSGLRVRMARIAEQKLRNVELALQHLDEAVRDDPSDLDVLAELERLRRAQQDWPAVAEALLLRSRALASPKERADTLVEIARLRQNAMGDLGGAAQAYREALELDAVHERALDELATLAERTGDFETATATLRRLADRHSGPERAKAFARLGEIVEVHLADKAQAAEHYDRALFADPDCVDALSPLRRIREEARDFEAAFDLASREAALVRDARQKALLWGKAGDLARNQLGQSAAAIECYERALVADEEDLPSAASLGELYLQHQKPEQAHGLLVRAARGFQRSDAARSLELWSLAGSAAEQLERFDDAVKAYEAGLELFPTARLPLLRLAELHEAGGRYERAFEACSDLILHHEVALGSRERAQVYLRMARSKRGMDDLEGAQRLAQKAHDLAPAEPSVLALFGELLEATGAPMRAAEMWARLAKLGTDPADRRQHMLRAARLYGDHADAVEDAIVLLGELNVRDPADLEVVRDLARMRERAGDRAAAAAALAKTASLHEGRVRADLLVDAARVMGSGSRARDEVVAFLLDATQACPTHAAALYQLCVLLEAAGEPRALAELLEEAARAFESDEAASVDAPEGRLAEAHALYRRAEDLYRYRLDAPLEALRVARKARELERGDEDDHIAFVRLLDEAATRSQRLDLKHEAVEAWLEIAEKQPSLLDAERRLYALRRDLGHGRLARVHAEILAAYGEATAAERHAFELEYGDGKSPPPPVPKEGEPVGIPEHPAEASPLARVFELLGHPLLTALEGDLPEPRPKKRDRVKLSELEARVAGPILDVVDLFGVQAPNVYLRPDATRSVQAGFVEGRPALLVCPPLAEGELEGIYRFWIGASLSLLRPRALALVVSPLELIRDALEGLVREKVPASELFGDPKLVRKRGRAVERLLSPTALAEIVDRLEAWYALSRRRSSLLTEREAVLHTADRAGLLASGSPLIALSALGATGRKERARALPVIEYAASRHFSRILARPAR